MPLQVFQMPQEQQVEREIPRRTRLEAISNVSNEPRVQNLVSGPACTDRRWIEVFLSKSREFVACQRYTVGFVETVRKEGNPRHSQGRF